VGLVYSFLPICERTFEVVFFLTIMCDLNLNLEVTEEKSSSRLNQLTTLLSFKEVFQAIKEFISIHHHF
jgi:hypothetical protein